eukprot:m.36678 g.36678  ORF g.36678 m.36678 type:complete len:806 (+) comp11041_c0_seq3:571-2988(+)
MAARCVAAVALGCVVLGIVAGAATASKCSDPPTGNVTASSPCDATLLSYLGTPGDTDIGLFVFYLVIMMFFFFGVAVAADIFMGSIEQITSVSRKVKVAGHEVEVLVWNKTVANLSLMALGSSAPEILLAIIEVMGRGFEAGELGPGTIVGSAAFNMLMIIAICVSIDEVKRVKHINVLYCTAAFSVFAYIWLYLMVSQISPGRIEVWEAVVTILMFPLLLGIAFAADQGWIDGNAVSKTRKSLVRTLSRRRALERDASMVHERLVSVGHANIGQGSNQWNRKFQKLVKRIKKYRPELPATQIYIEAFEELKGHRGAPEPHTSNQHIQRHMSPDNSASDLLDDTPEDPGTVTPPLDEELYPIQPAGSASDDSVVSNVDASELRAEASASTSNGGKASAAQLGSVSFESAKLRVLKNGGSVDLHVWRRNGRDGDVKVTYTTQSASGVAGEHFREAKGVLLFPAHEAESCRRTITVSVIDNDTYGPNKWFSVRLDSDQQLKSMEDVCEVEIHETYQFTGLCDRIVKVTSAFIDQLRSDTQADNDYIEQIRVAFRREEDDDDDGDGSGQVEDGEEAPADTDAIVINTPEDAPKGDDEGGSGGCIGAINAFGHYASVPWKVAFAIFTPPTGWMSGWGAFVISLVWIGLLTAIIGDLATFIGCSIGLKDTVTAISFVALGTSIPDTFASKIAAEEDEDADPAIGNVTGSNAVNVFLGVGLSWLAGSAYQEAHGNEFCIEEGTLATSVVIFSTFFVAWFAVLTVRRHHPAVGGELGGKGAPKWLTIGFFCLMWVMYIILSSLVAYDYISPL